MMRMNSKSQQNVSSLVEVLDQYNESSTDTHHPRPLIYFELPNAYEHVYEKGL